MGKKKDARKAAEKLARDAKAHAKAKHDTPGGAHAAAGKSFPDELRHGVEAALAKAASPEGRAVIAAGIGMAAAGIVAALERRQEKDAAATAAAATGGPEDGAPAPGASRAKVDPQIVGLAVGRSVDALLAKLATGTKPG